MIGRPPKKKNLVARRKPRDICQSIITDRLVHIERRAEKGPLTEEETNFVLQSYKCFSEAEHADAEVSYLESLTPDQSNQLEDILAGLEDEDQAQAS